MSHTARIEEQAAQWVLRRQESQWNESHQAELNAWLSASTAHEVAYLRMEHGWRKVDRMVALGNQGLVPSTLSHGAARIRRPWVYAMAASLLVALACVTWQYGGIAPGSYTTRVGEHEVVPLPDGSRIELNTNTRVRTRVDDAGRDVWLDRGEAFFSVKSAPSMPFVVHAGPRRITVLGTQFSVRREGDQVRVVVTEGRVQVADLVSNPDITPIIVTAGNAVRAEGGSNLLEPGTVAKAAEEVSWRHGALVFNQTTLAEAAREFNRYNDSKLIVEDPAVAGTRIGGSFDATNVESFARLLHDAFGLEVTAEGDNFRIAR